MSKKVKKNGLDQEKINKIIQIEHRENELY